MAWIRSQDKNVLINVELVELSEYDLEILGHSGARVGVIGTYSTEEKALKVLDMIEKTIIQNETVYAYIFKETGVKTYNIFQMPADEEM